MLLININIYRKQTQTDPIIPNGSTHPFSQKVSYFNFLLCRFERIPLKKRYYENELNIIYDVDYGKIKSF